MNIVQIHKLEIVKFLRKLLQRKHFFFANSKEIGSWAIIWQTSSLSSLFQYLLILWNWFSRFWKKRWRNSNFDLSTLLWIENVSLSSSFLSKSYNFFQLLIMIKRPGQSLTKNNKHDNWIIYFKYFLNFLNRFRIFC